MKKIIIMIFSLAIIFSLCFNVFASGGGVDKEHSEETTGTQVESAEMRIVYCDCGGIMVVSYGSWSAWTGVSQSYCTHGYSWGVDITENRTRTVSTKCNKCGYGYQNQQSESRVVCHGFNNY